MVQREIKHVAVYCRVSTDDQNCDRQERDLKGFAERAGYEIIAVYKEVASGARNDRQARSKLIAQCQRRELDAVLVTELTRWGRSTLDLLSTLDTLAGFGVSVIAQTGFQFDLSTAQGKLLAGVMASLAEFERDLLTERVKSGLAAARARGLRLGRQPGQNPSDKYAQSVLRFIQQGRSYRWISHELQISKTTVAAIARRSKVGASNTG